MRCLHTSYLIVPVLSLLVPGVTSCDGSWNTGDHPAWPVSHCISLLFLEKGLRTQWMWRQFWMVTIHFQIQLEVRKLNIPNFPYTGQAHNPILTNKGCWHQKPHFQKKSWSKTNWVTYSAYVETYEIRQLGNILVDMAPIRMVHKIYQHKNEKVTGVYFLQ